MICDGTVLLVFALVLAIALGGWWHAHREARALQEQVWGLTRRLREAEE